MCPHWRGVRFQWFDSEEIPPEFIQYVQFYRCAKFCSRSVSLHRCCYCCGGCGLRWNCECALCTAIHTYTVNLLIMDTLGQPRLSFVRRLSSLRKWKCIRSIGRNIFGLQIVSFVEKVSLFRSVHYRILHCMHTYKWNRRHYILRYVVPYIF